MSKLEENIFIAVNYHLQGGKWGFGSVPNVPGYNSSTNYPMTKKIPDSLLSQQTWGKHFYSCELPLTRYQEEAKEKQRSGRSTLESFNQRPANMKLRGHIQMVSPDLQNHTRGVEPKIPLVKTRICIHHHHKHGLSQPGKDGGKLWDQ